MGIRGLGEVILYVRDMASQVAFYRDVLGLPLLFADRAEDFAEAHWVLFDTGACKLALHDGGTGRLGEDAPKFVFLVDDIEGERSRLIEQGVPVQEIFSPARGVRVCNAVDPEGNRFSLESQESRA